MKKTTQYYQYKYFLKQSSLTLLKSQSIDKLRWKFYKQTFIKEGMFFILHIKSSLTNTLVSLTNYKGKILFHASCGRLGFQNKKRRKSPFAVQSLLRKTRFRLKEYKGKKGFLFLNGFAKPRYSILKHLKRSRVKLLGIRDVTPKPHNGCRPKKKRRL